MALVVTATLPFQLAAQAVQMRMQAGQFRDAGAAVGASNAVASEAVSAIRVVAAYSLQDDVAKMYSEVRWGARGSVCVYVLGGEGSQLFTPLYVGGVSVGVEEAEEGFSRNRTT